MGRILSKKKPEPPKEAKESDVLAKLAKSRRPGEKCGLCGHWSPATEYGLDEKSGYCDRWEKLTDRDYWCEEYISQDRFKQMQDQLAEDNEEFMDEET